MDKGEIGFETIVRFIIFLAVLIILIAIVYVFKEKLGDLVNQIKEWVRFI